MRSYELGIWYKRFWARGIQHFPSHENYAISSPNSYLPNETFRFVDLRRVGVSQVIIFHILPKFPWSWLMNFEGKMRSTVRYSFKSSANYWKLCAFLQENSILVTNERLLILESICQVLGLQPEFVPVSWKMVKKASSVNDLVRYEPWLVITVFLWCNAYHFCMALHHKN